MQPAQTKQCHFLANKFSECWHFRRQFFWKIVEIIGSKAPWNYSDQFRSNNLRLLERPKSQNAMLSNFLKPWEALFMDLNIPRYFLKKYKKYGKHALNIFCCEHFWDLEVRKIRNLEILTSCI